MISRTIVENEVDLTAPELLSLEVVHALRKRLNLKLLSERHAIQAFRNLCMMPIEYLSHAELVQRVWQLKANMSAYDASYVALAEKLSAPIWTCDSKYQNTPIHKAKTVFFDPAP